MPHEPVELLRGHGHRHRAPPPRTTAALLLPGQRGQPGIEDSRTADISSKDSERPIIWGCSIPMRRYLPATSLHQGLRTLVVSACRHHRISVELCTRLVPPYLCTSAVRSAYHVVNKIFQYRVRFWTTISLAIQRYTGSTQGILVCQCDPST